MRELNTINRHRWLRKSIDVIHLSRASSIELVQFDGSMDLQCRCTIIRRAALPPSPLGLASKKLNSKIQWSVRISRLFTLGSSMPWCMFRRFLCDNTSWPDGVAYVPSTCWPGFERKMHSTTLHYSKIWDQQPKNIGKIKNCPNANFDMLTDINVLQGLVVHRQNRRHTIHLMIPCTAGVSPIKPKWYSNRGRLRATATLADSGDRNYQSG